MAKNYKILLTTLFRPYSGKNSKYNKEGDEEWLDYLSSRLTKEPGPFTMSDYLSGTSLAVIGANLDADVTLLAHPSLEEFIEELKKGPDFVGINFLIKGLGKLFPMISAVRKHAPQAKVVIGGFGTMLHNVSEVGADYICKGEGVSFFRNLIGQNPRDPMQQPLVTGDVTLKLFRNYDFLPSMRYAELTHGFGCPHKCEFCATSAFYGYLHIPFAQGNDIYDAMVDVHSKTGIDYFYIYEEDMALYQKMVRQWGGMIRDDPDRVFSWGSFSTVKSLSRWDLEELVSMGFSHVWIGVESVHSPFAKSVGREIAQIFEDLHDLGVTTTGSAIFGLDEHRPDNLQPEVENLIDLYPSTMQLGTLMPAEGTELRRRLEAEGRIREANYYDADLHSEILIHPHFKPGDLRAAVFDAYDQFYEAVGPAAHRIPRTLLRGARRLKKSTSSVLRRRAEKLTQRAIGARPIFLDSLDYLPSAEVRETVEETLAWMREEAGPPSAEEEAQGRLVRRIFDLEMAKKEALPEEPREPDLRMRRWIRGQEVPAQLHQVSAA